MAGYQIIRQDASIPQVVATVPSRNFGQMVALAMSDIQIGAAIIGLRLGLGEHRNSLSGTFTVRFDESGYIEYTTPSGAVILWYFHEVETDES